MNKEEFAKELREKRNLAGLTQAALSEMTGIPIRTIKSWECASREASDYVQRFVIDKLVESITNNKYLVVSMEWTGINVAEFIEFHGTLEECCRKEMELRRGVDTTEKDFKTISAKEYINEKYKVAALKEYQSMLTKEELEEKIEINGRTFPKHIIEFNNMWNGLEI